MKNILFILSLALLFFVQGCGESIGKNRRGLRLSQKVDYYRKGLAISEKEKEDITVSIGYLGKRNYIYDEYVVFKVKIQNSGKEKILIDTQKIYYTPTPEIIYHYEKNNSIPYRDSANSYKIKNLKEIIISKINAVDAGYIAGRLRERYEGIELDDGDEGLLSSIGGLIDIFTGYEESEEEKLKEQQEETKRIAENQRKIHDIEKYKGQYERFVENSIFKHTLMPGESIQGNIYFETEMEKEGKRVAVLNFDDMVLTIPLGDKNFDFEYSGI